MNADTLHLFETEAEYFDFWSKIDSAERPEFVGSLILVFVEYQRLSRVLEAGRNVLRAHGNLRSYDDVVRALYGPR